MRGTGCLIGTVWNPGGVDRSLKSTHQCGTALVMRVRSIDRLKNGKHNNSPAFVIDSQPPQSVPRRVAEVGNSTKTGQHRPAVRIEQNS